MLSSGSAIGTSKLVLRSGLDANNAWNGMSTWLLVTVLGGFVSSTLELVPTTYR